MVSLVNSHTNATRIGWHLWEIDLRFAPGLPPGWVVTMPSTPEEPFSFFSEAGSYLRLIDSCISQAQGPSRTCNESEEEEEGWLPCSRVRSHLELLARRLLPLGLIRERRPARLHRGRLHLLRRSEPPPRPGPEPLPVYPPDIGFNLTRVGSLV